MTAALRDEIAKILAIPAVAQGRVRAVTDPQRHTDLEQAQEALVRAVPRL